MMKRLLFGIVSATLVLAGCMGRPRPELFPYRVVCGETKEELADRAAEWIRMGYGSAGGVEIVGGWDGLRWCQALTSK